jgi:hypothetical protein
MEKKTSKGGTGMKQEREGMDLKKGTSEGGVSDSDHGKHRRIGEG